MAKILIKNANVVLIDDILYGYDVLVSDGVIVRVKKNIKCKDAKVLFAKDKYLTPGFVDIHTHGGYGADFMDSTEEAYVTALKFHAYNGTTSVVATSCTAAKSNIIKFIEHARKYIKNPSVGCAKVLGVHLEGPYLSEKNRGAQKLEELAIPNKDDYAYILENSDVIKTVTISPELDGAAEMCKKMSEKGITVCGGHDYGIYPEFVPAIENGLKHATHLFCAMSDLRFKDGKRNVGFREYVLIDDNITAELIADNKHIPPLLAKLVYKSKGSDKLCVVSDSLRCAGMPDDGTLYTLGTGEDAQKIKILDGVAVLENGVTFAGSVTPVRKMVKNLIDVGIPLIEAVKIGTKTPALIVGEDKIGEIKVGNYADLCILDANFNVENVIINGELI